MQRRFRVGQMPIVVEHAVSQLIGNFVNYYNRMRLH